MGSGGPPRGEHWSSVLPLEGLDCSDRGGGRFIGVRGQEGEKRGAGPGKQADHAVIVALAMSSGAVSCWAFFDCFV